MSLWKHAKNVLYGRIRTERDQLSRQMNVYSAERKLIEFPVWQQAKMNKRCRIKIYFTKSFVNNIGTVILTKKEPTPQRTAIFESDIRVARLWLLAALFSAEMGTFCSSAFPLRRISVINMFATITVLQENN